MKPLPLILTMLALPAVAGCAIVKSSSDQSSSATITNGFTYYLPNVMMKIEASRSAVSADSIAKAAAAASALKEALKSATAELQQADAARAAKKGVYDKAVADLSFDATAKAELKKEYDKALTDYSKKKAAVDFATEKAANSLQTLADISNHVGACVKTVTLTRQPIEADTGHLFTAKLNHNWARADELDVKSNELGLLESVDLTSEDKTGEIAVTIAELVLKVQNLSALTAMDLNSMDNAGDTVNCGLYAASWIFDPSDMQASMSRINSDILSNVGLKIEIKAAPWVAQVPPANPVGGLYYRRQIPYQFNILEGNKVIQSARVSLPNKGPIALVPMDAGAFVTTERNAQFHNGILVAQTVKRPSEIEGLLKIPAGIIKAILGGEE